MWGLIYDPNCLSTNYILAKFLDENNEFANFERIIYRKTFTCMERVTVLRINKLS